MEAQRGVVRNVRKDARELSVKVDGKALDPYALVFSRSVVWSVHLPPGNIFGVDPQVCGPGVNSGYYVRLPALKPGMHTIHWHGRLAGSNPDLRTVQDVTYHLKVRPPVS